MRSGDAKNQDSSLASQLEAALLVQGQRGSKTDAAAERLLDLLCQTASRAGHAVGLSALRLAHVAARRGRPVPMLQALAGVGIYSSAETEETLVAGRTLLMSACHGGCAEAVRGLLDRGHQVDRRGWILIRGRKCEVRVDLDAMEYALLRAPEISATALLTGQKSPVSMSSTGGSAHNRKVISRAVWRGMGAVHVAIARGMVDLAMLLLKQTGHNNGEDSVAHGDSEWDMQDAHGYLPVGYAGLSVNAWVRLGTSAATRDVMYGDRHSRSCTHNPFFSATLRALEDCGGCENYSKDGERAVAAGGSGLEACMKKVDLRSPLPSVSASWTLLHDALRSRLMDQNNKVCQKRGEIRRVRHKLYRGPLDKLREQANAQWIQSVLEGLWGCGGWPSLRRAALFAVWTGNASAWQCLSVAAVKQACCSEGSSTGECKGALLLEGVWVACDAGLDALASSIFADLAACEANLPGPKFPTPVQSLALAERAASGPLPRLLGLALSWAAASLRAAEGLWNPAEAASDLAAGGLVAHACGPSEDRAEEGETRGEAPGLEAGDQVAGVAAALSGDGKVDAWLLACALANGHFATALGWARRGLPLVLLQALHQAVPGWREWLQAMAAASEKGIPKCGVEYEGAGAGDEDGQGLAADPALHRCVWALFRLGTPAGACRSDEACYDGGVTRTMERDEATDSGTLVESPGGEVGLRRAWDIEPAALRRLAHPAPFDLEVDAVTGTAEADGGDGADADDAVAVWLTEYAARYGWPGAGEPEVLTRVQRRVGRRRGSGSAASFGGREPNGLVGIRIPTWLQKDARPSFCCCGPRA